MEEKKTIDTSRFNFLKGETTLDKALQKVNLFLQGIVDAKPYQMNWEHVLQEYDKLGVGDVAEFACSYSFGWHAKERRMSDKVSQQAMYLEIIKGIKERRENVI